jgi:hypothetical protein
VLPPVLTGYGVGNAICKSSFDGLLFIGVTALCPVYGFIQTVLAFKKLVRKERYCLFFAKDAAGINHGF